MSTFRSFNPPSTLHRPDVHIEAGLHRVRACAVAAFVALVLSAMMAPCRTTSAAVEGPSAGSAAVVPAIQTLQNDGHLDVPDPGEGRAGIVNQDLLRKTALYFACFGIYLILGVIFFIYWRRIRRSLPMLSVALLSSVMAVHTAAISGVLPYLLPALFDPALSVTVESVSYLLLNGLIAFMLWAFFPESFRPFRGDWMRTVNSTIAGSAVAASIVLSVVAVSTASTADALVFSISRWITLVLMVVVVAIGLKVIDRGQVTLTAIGLTLLVVGSIHDVLFASIDEGGRPYLITFAFLGFVVLQSYVVVRRSAESAEFARTSGKLREEVEARTKELRAATVAAQAANIAKTEYVTDVTHELRTPLTSMLGYIQLLRDELKGKLREEQLRFIDTLEASGNRLLNLVNNLLDLARLEAGRMEIKLEPVDLRTIVDTVRGQLFPIASQKGLYLNTAYETDEVTILADKHWLQLVVSNLVSNAVKYTREGGVEVRVVKSRMGKKDAVAVKVIDTGRGISSEFMPHLFERFTRDEKVREEAPTGSGLGLTISRELLHRMGGEIFVESKLHEGSTFTVLLPVSESGDEPDAAA